jgi:uncharacterized protein DUF1579
MKKLLLGSALILVSAAFALAQEGPPKPAAELAGLKYFAGSWSCSGDAPAGPFGPAHKTQSSLMLKSDLDGFWYAGTMTEMKTASNPHPVKGMLHLGYDATSKQFVQVWVDNMGAWATQMSPGWQGETLVFSGDQTVMGEKAMARDTLVKKSDTEFTHKFELTMKGQTSTIIDETCKRAGARK